MANLITIYDRKLRLYSRSDANFLVTTTLEFYTIQFLVITILVRVLIRFGTLRFSIVSDVPHFQNTESDKIVHDLFTFRGFITHE